MITTNYKAGDRVVSRKALTDEFLFGTIVGFGEGPAESRWLCAKEIA